MKMETSNENQMVKYIFMNNNLIMFHVRNVCFQRFLFE